VYVAVGVTVGVSMDRVGVSMQFCCGKKVCFAVHDFGETATALFASGRYQEFEKHCRKKGGLTLLLLLTLSSLLLSSLLLLLSSLSLLLLKLFLLLLYNA
jgi:hypothetical protein